MRRSQINCISQVIVLDAWVCRRRAIKSCLDWREGSFGPQGEGYGGASQAIIARPWWAERGSTTALDVVWLDLATTSNNGSVVRYPVRSD